MINPDVKDLISDMHQYFYGKKVALVGDPDQLISMTEFLVSIDMCPLHVITGTPGKKFEKRIREITKEMPYEVNVKAKGDLFLLHQWIKNEPVDLLIGNTYGKYISRDEGRRILYQIARSADVFLTNYLPNKRQKMKFDVEHIRAVNPNIIYAQYQYGGLARYDRRTQERVFIAPHPESGETGYKWNWNTPLIISPHNNERLYYGAEKLFRSDDRGESWVAISPDLTRNDKEKQGRNGGPLTPENVGAEFYNTIFYIIESPHEAGTIWVGSDDGLVHITRDGGQSWQRQHDGRDADMKGPLLDVWFRNQKEGFAVGVFNKIFHTTDGGGTWVRQGDHVDVAAATVAVAGVASPIRLIVCLKAMVQT